MAFDLEEQEKLDALKDWWKKHGNAVTWGITLLLLVVAGIQGWRYWQLKQSNEAAALYGGLTQAMAQEDLRKVRELAGQIMDKHPRTAYAPSAALIAAKVNFENGDAKSAKAQLNWVLEHSRDEAVRQIARLRLAAVLMDEQAYSEALLLLEETPAAGFQALTAATKGDILAVQGKRDEARAAYRAALKSLKADEDYARILRVKLNALGG
jgi:predicted negative regulator of RcsB-dependent stress response